MNDHRLTRLSFMMGDQRRVGDRTDGLVINFWHDVGKALVDPVHNFFLGSEVDRQSERKQADHPQPVALCLDKQSHFRFPKPVNGLHGVAHGKKRPAVPRLPAGGQPFKQLILGKTRVLKFIYQDMTDAIIQGKGQIRRGFRLPQRILRPQRDFGKIHLAGLAEHALKMAGGHAKDFK